MAETLEMLSARLRALEDREAIREIIACYGPLADSGNAAAVAALWAEDGSYAVKGMEPAQGRNAIAALIDGPVHRELMAQGCAHVLGPVAIELHGDTATARGHSVVFHHEHGAFAAIRVAANRWHLARGADGWQVTHRDNALLDGEEAARALLSRPVVRRRS